MKIGVAEVIYPKGHKKFDIKTINILSKIGDVYYFSYPKFITNKAIKIDVNIINIRKQFIFKRFYKLIRLFRIINLIIISRKIRSSKLKLDKLVFLSFDNTLYSIVKKIFKDIDVFVIHHDDIDKIVFNIKNREYYNLVKHIVFDDYIKEGLINKTRCDENKIFVIPNPIEFIPKKTESNYRKPCLLSIGWSNDENLILKAVELSKNITHELSYKIILRSKIYTYKDKNLEVISGFLESNEYEKLISDSDIQIIIYPDTFRYRYSATFQTAILHNQYVIVNNVYLGSILKMKYPQSVMVINSVDELFNLNESVLSKKPSLKDVNKFLIEHSEDNIANKYSSAFQVLFD